MLPGFEYLCETVAIQNLKETKWAGERFFCQLGKATMRIITSTTGSWSIDIIKNRSFIETTVFTHDQKNHFPIFSSDFALEVCLLNT